MHVLQPGGWGLPSALTPNSEPLHWSLLLLPRGFSALCCSCSLLLLATQKADSDPCVHWFLLVACLYPDGLSSLIPGGLRAVTSKGHCQPRESCSSTLVAESLVVLKLVVLNCTLPTWEEVSLWTRIQESKFNPNWKLGARSISLCFSRACNTSSLNKSSHFCRKNLVLYSFPKLGRRAIPGPQRPRPESGLWQLLSRSQLGQIS